MIVLQSSPNESVKMVKAGIPSSNAVSRRAFLTATQSLWEPPAALAR